MPEHANKPKYLPADQRSKRVHLLERCLDRASQFDATRVMGGLRRERAGYQQNRHGDKSVRPKLVHREQYADGEPWNGSNSERSNDIQQKQPWQPDSSTAGNRFRGSCYDRDARRLGSQHQRNGLHLPVCSGKCESKFRSANVHARRYRSWRRHLSADIFQPHNFRNEISEFGGPTMAIANSNDTRRRSVVGSGRILHRAYSRNLGSFARWATKGGKSFSPFGIPLSSSLLPLPNVLNACSFNASHRRCFYFATTFRISRINNAVDANLVNAKNEIPDIVDCAIWFDVGFE